MAIIRAGKEGFIEKEKIMVFHQEIFKENKSKIN